MTDKELIKQEIERLKDCASPIVVCDTLLNLIDSLSEEPISEDLEEEIERYINEEVFVTSENVVISKHHEFHNFYVENLVDVARHFAEWQKQIDDKHIGDLQWEAYLKGEQDTKQQMMKDVVDAFVNTYENTDDSNYVEFVTEQSPYKFKETEKCKLIIIKEEQQ